MRTHGRIYIGGSRSTDFDISSLAIKCGSLIKAMRFHGASLSIVFGSLCLSACARLRGESAGKDAEMEDVLKLAQHARQAAEIYGTFLISVVGWGQLWGCRLCIFNSGVEHVVPILGELVRTNCAKYFLYRRVEKTGLQRPE